MREAIVIYIEELEDYEEPALRSFLEMNGVKFWEGELP